MAGGSRTRARRIVAGLAVLPAVLLTTSAHAVPLPVLVNGTTERVSLSATGAQLAIDEWLPIPAAVSANGRFVAFEAGPTSVAPSPPSCKGPIDTVAGRIYLRDLTTRRVEMVSLDALGCPVHGWRPALSADGRFVLFSGESNAIYGHNVIPGLTSVGPVNSALFVRDRLLGRTVAVTVGFDHRLNNMFVYHGSISADGRFVAFDSGATNLVRGMHHTPSNLKPNVFVRDLKLGRTELVGRIDTAEVGRRSYYPSISGDGRWVTFMSSDDRLTKFNGYGNLIPTTYIGGVEEIYLYDRSTHRFQAVSHNPQGQLGNGFSNISELSRAVSDDGRYVVFTSHANNLTADNTVPDDSAVPDELFDDGTLDVYVYDRVRDRLTRASTGPGGIPADEDSFEPTISGDGNWVTYTSYADNLGDPDLSPTGILSTQGGSHATGLDVYLYDRLAGVNHLISQSTDGTQADYSSYYPVLNRDGRLIVFASLADNLVPGDTNGVSDIFLHRHTL